MFSSRFRSSSKMDFFSSMYLAMSDCSLRSSSRNLLRYAPEKNESLARRWVLFSSHFSKRSSRLRKRSFIESPSAGWFSVSESLDVLGSSEVARGLVGICSNGAFGLVGVVLELLVDEFLLAPAAFDIRLFDEPDDSSGGGLVRLELGFVVLDVVVVAVETAAVACVVVEVLVVLLLPVLECV